MIDQTPAIEVWARMLCAADAHVNDGNHPAWPQLPAQSRDNYRKAARWLFPRMTVTQPATSEEPKPTAPDRHTVDTITSDALDALYELRSQSDLDATYAEAAVARIRSLHQPVGVVAAAEFGEPPTCGGCRRDWPCPTYNASVSVQRRPSTARTVTLREAADIAEDVAVRLHAAHDVGGSTGAYEVMEELRRMADGPAPAATEATEPIIDRPFRSHRTPRAGQKITAAMLAEVRDLSIPEQDPEAIRKPERCCVCGGHQVTYHNFRDQPFCNPCADCECNQLPCVRTAINDPEVAEPEPAHPHACTYGTRCPNCRD